MGVTPNASGHIAGCLDSNGPLVSKTCHRDHRVNQAGDVADRELSPMSKKVKIFSLQSCENPAGSRVSLSLDSFRVWCVACGGYRVCLYESI